MKDPLLEAYCNSIESFFFRLKGRQGTFSPKDFAKLRTWFEANIALDTALEGIEEAFQAQAAGRNRHEEEVNSLAFCESFILQLARRHTHQ